MRRRADRGVAGLRPGDWAFVYANPALGTYGDLPTNRAARGRSIYFTARFGGYDPAGRSVAH